MTKETSGEAFAIGALVAIDSPGLRAKQHIDELRGRGYEVTVVEHPPRGPLRRAGAWATQRWRVTRWRARAKQAATDVTRGLTILDLATARDLTHSGMVFPFGHPMPGHVYVRHPVDQSRFLCFAEFHEQILTEKVTEGARLLLALGARDIKVEWDTSAGKKAKGGLEVDLGDLGRVAESAGFSRGASGSYSIAVHGARTGRRPIPADLVWRADPAFRLAVEAAESDPESFSLVVSTTGQSVVNADVTVPLKHVNLQLGGMYREWEKLRIVLNATFRDE